MSVQAEFKVGNMIIKVNGANEKELISQAAFFSEMPSSCGLCKSPNLRFSFRTPQDYTFYALECADCKAEYQFGQHKPPNNTLFHKREWSPEHQQGNSQQGGYQQQSQQQAPQQQRAPQQGGYQQQYYQGPPQNNPNQPGGAQFQPTNQVPPAGGQTPQPGGQSDNIPF